jgi:hypothetical protein
VNCGFNLNAIVCKGMLGEGMVLSVKSTANQKGTSHLLIALLQRLIAVDLAVCFLYHVSFLYHKKTIGEAFECNQAIAPYLILEVCSRIRRSHFNGDGFPC